MVGVAEVLQQTPLTVIGAPPSEVIVPPDRAEDWVIPEMAAVVSTGTVGGGVLSSFLQAVKKVKSKLSVSSTSGRDCFFIKILMI